MTINMVIVDALGVVHDLNTERRCAEVSKLHGELSRGKGRYASVKGVEVIAYELPGCRQCFGTEANFREYIRTT